MNHSNLAEIRQKLKNSRWSTRLFSADKNHDGVDGKKNKKKLCKITTIYRCIDDQYIFFSIQVKQYTTFFSAKIASYLLPL